MHDRSPARATLGLLALVLMGCAGDPLRPADAPEPADPPIRTDREEYAVRYEEDGASPGLRVMRLSIGFRYTNRTSSGTYLPACHGVFPPAMEKWEGGRWVTAFRPTVLLCLAPPAVVPPGGTYDYAFEVYAVSRGSNAFPQFEVAEVAGAYRLVWEVYETWTPDGGTPGLGRMAPLEGRVSNTFHVAR